MVDRDRVHRHTSYDAEGNTFRVRSRLAEKNQLAHLFRYPQAIERIVEYSRRADNRIIEIVDLGPEEHVTRYYPWTPLVIIHECNIYPRKVFRERSAAYREFIANRERGERFWRDCLGEFNRFAEATGCMFTDVSSNNVLVNEDISDFRIIDLFSLARMEGSQFINPGDLLINAKYGNPGLYRRSKILRAFLGKDIEARAGWVKELERGTVGHWELGIFD